MANRKYDYNDTEFYDEILLLAAQGLNDAEIADKLDISAELFCKIKAGKYDKWTAEENEKNSKRLVQVLTRGRARIIGAIRGRYLKGALGGIKTRSKTKKFIECRCECGGQDENCEICGGTGKIVRSDKWIVLETETDMAPNMQALATLLYHHDPEWRKVERRLDEEAQDVPQTEKGIDIGKWLNAELEND